MKNKLKSWSEIQSVADKRFVNSIMFLQWVVDFQNDNPDIEVEKMTVHELLSDYVEKLNIAFSK